LNVGLGDRRFRKQLGEFCRVESILLLHFTAEQLCSDAAGTSDPGSSFVSLLHLNRIGAARLRSSERRCGGDARWRRASPTGRGPCRFQLTSFWMSSEFGCRP
jgi:hypothetical protein